ncbi:hypothetical protein VDG1235_1251 [Verrucomicrobiia bacterium DG1235]|nr:hypothetical protein VDG1235_1251 [Verrucomicrobiae bacterium DG1235]
MTLLAAYEDFTRRETVCLREGNFEPMLRLQEKKAKVIAEFALLEAGTSKEENEDISRRISVLQAREESNALILKEKIAGNRQEVRKLTLNAISANKLRRVYSAPADRSLSSGTLKGRA